MRWSNFFIPTLRDNPSDAEAWTREAEEIAIDEACEKVSARCNV
jgi:hypothetical protein